jgi:hypothetical protein
LAIDLRFNGFKSGTMVGFVVAGCQREHGGGAWWSLNLFGVEREIKEED